MEKGRISVQTDNIFPIIKKFLYSDHEIFLRELVSNAIDATQKINSLSRSGEKTGELGDLTIRVTLDEKKKTLKIIDRGIGMTADEVKKYINQIAFSSAQEFIEKFKDKTNIIGHFGLGFYSSFMVADEVTIRTLSYKENAEAVQWHCDGSPEFEMKACDKKDRGTEIILKINDESKEFLEKSRIDSLLNKYCRFLPVAIQFGEKEVEEGEGDKKKKIKKPHIVNNPDPLWTKSPTELEDKDYLDFYRELYPYSEEPLFWIHLNVDYPFNLTGVLYFPKLSERFEVQKNKIQLYCNQVFVTDQVEEVVPEWLMLLHGVIDSPDIPLNVSRSYLQSDPNVKKINSHISKKVADKLDEIFRKERENFENKWEHLGIFIKYGMLSDDKFYEKAQKFCLYEDAQGNKNIWEDFRKQHEKQHTDKNKNFIALYTTDPEAQHAYIEKAETRAYSVIKFNTIIDSHFLSFLEQKLENTQFKRVDADTLDKLIEKEEESNVSTLSEKEETELRELFEKAIDNKGITVETKGMSTDEEPVLLTQPEFSRRMQEMSRLNGQMGNMPEFFNLVVNSNHPVAGKILRMKSGEKKTQYVKQLYDVALLTQGKLKGKKLTEFLQRSIDLMAN